MKPKLQAALPTLLIKERLGLTCYIGIKCATRIFERAMVKFISWLICLLRRIAATDLIKQVYEKPHGR